MRYLIQKVAKSLLKGFILGVLMVALAGLSTNCASIAGGKDSKQPAKKFIVENKSFFDLKVALGKINKEFFWGVTIPAGEKAVCSSDKLGLGSFIMCWVKDKGFDNMQCVRFYVTEETLPFLFDDEVDASLENNSRRI